MQEEMYHMSALDIHREGQREAVTVWGRGRRDRKRMARLQYSGVEGNDVFLHTEPPPSGRWLIKQLSLFGFKPKACWGEGEGERSRFSRLKNESTKSVLNEKDMVLE